MIFFLIERKSGGFKNTAYAALIIIGGICVYYGFHYPILNVSLGRGLYSFFLGVLLYRFSENVTLRLRPCGKGLVLIGIAASVICFRTGKEGNEFLCSAVIFALLLILILSCPGIDRFFARPGVQILYQPFYKISFELFCTQYVVLTVIGFIQQYRDLSDLAKSWVLFGGYIVLSCALAFLIKRTARPLFSHLFFKS